MINGNELAMGVLALGVLVFVIKYFSQLKEICCWKILLSSYIALIFACIFTLVEEFYAHDINNFIEHSCYMISSILFAIWCWRFSLYREEPK